MPTPPANHPLPINEIKAVVLDLFDTLVKWDPNELPVMVWRGREMRSTMPWVVPHLSDALGARFDYTRFAEIHAEVYGEINEKRRKEAIEITCGERWRRTLARLDAIEPGKLDDLADRLRRIHMAGVRGVTTTPPARRAAVRRLKSRFRLGLLSNFDDSETGRQIVGDTGVAELFEAVLISADTGLRKPNQKIFNRMLELLALRADQVLFVGDTPLDDVKGAYAAGMRTAWINPSGAPLPDDIPAPDLIIADLAELPARLGVV